MKTFPFANELLMCLKRLCRLPSTRTVKLSGLFLSNLLENRCFKHLVSTSFKEAAGFVVVSGKRRTEVQTLVLQLCTWIFATP